MLDILLSIKWLVTDLHLYNGAFAVTPYVDISSKHEGIRCEYDQICNSKINLGFRQHVLDTPFE